MSSKYKIKKLKKKKKTIKQFPVINTTIILTHTIVNITNHKSMKPFISLFRRLIQAIKKFEMEGNWFLGHREKFKSYVQNERKVTYKIKGYVTRFDKWKVWTQTWCFIIGRPNKSNQVTKSATFKKWLPIFLFNHSASPVCTFSI